MFMQIVLLDFEAPKAPIAILCRYQYALIASPDPAEKYRCKLHLHHLNFLETLTKRVPDLRIKPIFFDSP